jgi:hypothetical protein
MLSEIGVNNTFWSFLTVLCLMGEQLMTPPDLSNSLEEALGRDPIEFPFGFYIEDDHKNSAGGGFFWFKTEKDQQYAIQNDLIDMFSEGSIDDIKAVKAEIAAIIEQSMSNSDDDLLNNLNMFLRGIELRLQFIGSFEDLCKNKNEWSKYFREAYREECFDDIEDVSSKKLQSSIKRHEQEDFAAFVADYLI